jgi:DNA-binding winged helix-turn-helix (wHTH) protein/tetratricopeptide (TPR) repeat protein
VPDDKEAWMANERIVLAHEADFVIGQLAVYPSTREVARNGVRHVIEPRVMQVLVALHRAGGAVVSKDDLVHSCWDDRVVGEDAINRVISRLRKLGEGAGGGAFAVETVTRVGYRLRSGSGEPAATITPSEPLISRRHAIAGGSVAALGLGGWWLASRNGDEKSPIDDLMERGQQAVLYGTPEQTAFGISLLQQAVEKEPNNAKAWGRLSLAYGGQAQQSPQSDFERLMAKAESAGQRALQLDANNSDALVGKALGSRERGDRIERDRTVKDVLKRFPDNPTANRARAFQLTQVGRLSEALPVLQKTIALEPFAPTDAYALSNLLWSLKRLDEADSAMERAFRLWPRHYGVWFSRYKHLAYTKRFAAARAMVDDVGQRPTGIPESNFALCMNELAAFESGSADSIARAMTDHLKAAKTGVGFAQNAMTFAAEIGDGDTLFRLADALYFDRGTTMPQQRFTREQGLYNPGRRRPTYFLFTPPFAAHWRDPRFTALVEELGLADYWRKTGSTPDYRRS